MDIYYSIRIIYCNIPLLIKLILGGFNHEAKKYVKKGNVGIPIVKSDVIVFKKKLKNELILRTKYSLDRSNFKLNACAKAFFELCNGENTCEDIINEMNRRFSDIPVEVIQSVYGIGKI